MNLLNQISDVYWNLRWFILMAVVPFFPPSFCDISSLSATFLSIVIPSIISLFPFLIRNDHFRNFKKDINIKRSLSFMPIFWLVIGLWGGFFRHKENHEWPSFIEYFLLLFLIVFSSMAYFV